MSYKKAISSAGEFINDKATGWACQLLLKLILMQVGEMGALDKQADCFVSSILSLSPTLPGQDCWMEC